MRIWRAFSKEQDIKFVGEYVADAVWEIGQVYKAVADVEIADMSVQVEEVAELILYFFDAKKRPITPAIIPPWMDKPPSLIEKIPIGFEI